MEAVNLSQVSQTNFTNKQEVQKEAPKAPEQKKNGKKLLAAGAAAVATIAIAALAIKKRKLPKATQVADLKFNKGIAMKGDELFTGVAEHTNKEGDKFSLVYRDGVLQRSMKNINPKTGAGSLEKGNFIKHYSEANGTRKVSISEDTINGVQESSCEISKNSVVRTDASGKVLVSNFENGKIKEQILPDGTTRRWYENGQIKSEKLSDGTETLWHKNGQVASFSKEVTLEKDGIPRKIDISYDESGQLEAIRSKGSYYTITGRFSDGSGYYCSDSAYQDKKILKELFDKLGIEMPDNITFEC